MPKSFRQRRASSTSSSEEENHIEKLNDNNKKQDVNIKEKIEELKFIQKQRQRTHGIDVYSLAIGETKEATSMKSVIDNDPWRTRTGGLVDMKLLKEKRGNEIVKSMHSNFAKETNQRDEDAEMQKFIEEQLNRLKKDKQPNDSSSHDNNEYDQKNTSKQFKSPHDALFDVPKYLIESSSKSKQTELLSDQMLSGIPEVDLGLEERIRNIEETEKAKQSLLTSQNNTNGLSKQNDSNKINETKSINFVQHKRFDDSNQKYLDNINKRKAADLANSRDEPVVGDAPKHELLASSDVPSTSSSKDNKKSKHSQNKANNDKNNGNVEKATDDYCLERFRKNMRFNNKKSKIKIA